jgi:long-chain acyl-CoA synthetase
MESNLFHYGSFYEEEKVVGCSPILYNRISVNNGYKVEEISEDGFTTLLEGWAQAVVDFPDNNCLGHIEGDKYVWRTYKQAYHEARSLAKALYSEKMVPTTETDGKSFHMMGLYSRNRPEWCLTNWAIMHFSGTVVTLYNTLGEESLCYAFEHTELSIVSCDDSSFKKLLGFRQADKINTLKKVICFDAFSDEERDAFKELGVDVYSFTDLIQKGEALDDNLFDEMEKPTPDTTDVI